MEAEFKGVSRSRSPHLATLCSEYEQGEKINTVAHTLLICLFLFSILLNLQKVKNMCSSYLLPHPTSVLPFWQIALVCGPSNACKSHFSTQGGESIEQIASSVKMEKSGIKGSSPVHRKGKKEKHLHSKGNPDSLQV